MAVFFCTNSFTFLSRSSWPGRIATAIACCTSVNLFSKVLAGTRLAICAATVTEQPMASTWPDISACMAEASSSKRRISVPSGAALVTATSCVLARATPTRWPLRSAALLMLAPVLP